VKSVGEPLQESRFGVGEVHTGHADLGESQRTAPFPDGCHQRRTVDLSATPNHPPIVGTAPPPGSGRVTLDWRSEQDTEAFAGRLAAHAQVAHAFIALHGDLGAGKTTFVRHLLRALGVAGRIKSPTYAVVEPHQARTGPAWHFDFYRFDDPREWEDAGFRDVFDSPGLKLAEWPEKAAGLLPVADLDMRIELRADGGRTVTVDANTPRGRELLG
jgi:tRNA threonylcarbamoyladenosine biosynthesis protein TsaE